MPATKSRAAASSPSVSIVRRSRNSSGLLADPLPEPAEDARGLLELGRRDVVLVDGLEQEAAQADGGLQDRRRSSGSRSCPPSIVCSTTSVTMRPMRSDDDRPSTSTRSAGSVSGIQDPRPHRIVDVVIDVGDDVGDAGDLPFDRAGAVLGIGADRHAALPLRVPRDAVAHFPRQVEPLAVVLEHVDDAQALLVVIEAAAA